MKKTLVVLLNLALCLSVFAGCEESSHTDTSKEVSSDVLSGESETESKAESEIESETPSSGASSETESEGDGSMKEFVCETFEYVTTGNLRFIGIDAYRTGEDWDVLGNRSSEFLPELAPMLEEYGAFVSYPSALIHSGGKEVGVEEHFLIGYFFKADTPVPEGYDYYDIDAEVLGYGIYSVEQFPGDLESVYVMARDKILNDGYLIPYPDGYCHAEIYTNGRNFDGAVRIGYMFPTNRTR